MGLFDMNEDQSQALGLLGLGLMRGDFGQGAQLAIQHLAGAGERKQRQGLLGLQLENLRSEIDDRKLSREQKARLLKQAQELLSASPGYAPGQLGSGTFGALDTLPGQTAYPAPRAGGLAAAPFDKVVALKVAGGPDLLEPWKLAQSGMEEKAGSFRRMPDGSLRYVPNPETGRTFENGRVGLLPGHTDAMTRQTLATELPRAMLTAAGTVNLRDNPDGTQRPVSALDENPTLQAILRGYGIAGPRAATPAPAGGQQRPMVTPDEQRGRDAESIRIMQEELKNPNLPADARQAIERDLSRMTAAQSRPGFPTPTAYGMTNEQRAAAEAAKTKAVEQAKADVKPTEQRKAALDSANYMYNLLSTAVAHPGRETATGASGTFHPANYFPGTEATNFHKLLDQIKGSAFLHAFESLKGGGQITQVEGEKATNAIARLQTAQSDVEFKKALEEFQGVIGGAIRRMGGTIPAGGREAGGQVAPTTFSDPAKEQRYQEWKKRNGG